MATVDSSTAPYNDRFDSAKAYRELLFNPARALQNSELNEMQSNFQYQQKLLGNTVFKDGAIISGMAMTVQGTIDNSGDSDTGTDTSPNLISMNTLTSVNSKINYDSFTTNGKVTVQNASTLDTSYAGVKFSIDAKQGQVALRFKVKRTSGNLYKLSASFDSANLSVVSFRVDGQVIKTNFSDMSTVGVIDTSGNTINISDGNDHEYLVVFKVVNEGSYPITLVSNSGYNALTDGVSTFDISELKAEAGDVSTAWSLAPSDRGTAVVGSRNTIVKVDSGKLWLAGQVSEFNSQTINISGVGNETIGVKYDEDVVTAKEDDTLYDRAVGAPSQWQAGADRLHYVVTLTYNDPTTTTIFKLQDGKLQQEATKPEMTQLNEVLAKRTNDESGSYRVDGFNLWSEENKTDSTKVNLVVDKGTAYVLGFQISKPNATRIAIDKATEVSQSGNESFYYSSANEDNGILDNQPVKDIQRVTISVRTTETVNRATTSANPDSLSNRQVYKINQISDSANAKVGDYTEGTDYKLQNGNEISWGVSSGGKQPKSGSTYYVTYEYTKVISKGIDYKTNVLGQDELQATGISFVGMNGLKPIEGSLVQVDYEYFLARMDMITLDKHGDYHIIAGQPAPLNEVLPPQQQDPYTLRIGYVLVFPNSQKATTTLSSITRLPFSSLQDAVGRLGIAEDNISTMELRNKAMANEDPVTLKNTFSDNFMGFEKSDITDDDFNITYDIDKDSSEGFITTPAKAIRSLKPIYDATSSNLHLFDHMVTAPFSEEVAINQPIATNTISINPYQVGNLVGNISLDPESDIWTDTLVHTIYKDKHMTSKVTPSWLWNNNPNLYREYMGHDYRTWTDRNHSSNALNNVLQSTTNGGTSATTETLLEYGRAKTLTFTAENLAPLADNLILTIDGQPFNITPASGYSSGSTSGSMKADSTGIAKGSINIPANTLRAGTREVVLKNDHNIASINYVIKGLQDTNTQTLNRTYRTYSLYDPVAETFSLAKDKVLTGVSLAFANKPSEDGADKDGHRSTVSVQIRKVSNDGFPTNEIMAEKILQPSDVKTSETGSVFIDVKFDDPKMLSATEQYAIIISSDSAEYQVFIATNGSKRLDNRTMLNQQAYADGVFFTSSNSSTWTADQWSDLTFKIYTANFSDTGSIVFQTIYPKNEYFLDDKGNPLLDTNGNKIVMNIDQLILMSTYLTPDNTGLKWDYRIVTTDQPDTVKVTDMQWQPITNLVSVDLTANAREIQLRATFTAKKNLSPILALDDLSLVTHLTDTKGTYISRNIDMTTSKFNQLKIQFESALPVGSSATVYYSLDAGKSWTQLAPTDLTEEIQVDRDYKRYTYKKLLHNESKGDNALEDKIKYRIDLTSDSGVDKPRVRRLQTSMAKVSGVDGAEA